VLRECHSVERVGKGNTPYFKAIFTDTGKNEGTARGWERGPEEFIYLRLANRQGLITGATGTGKTVTLQGLAEGFSDQGVPVFCADVKSDLSGLADASDAKPWIEARGKEIGYKNEFKGYPVIFWDLFGEQGHPIRATIFEMGPLLLSRLMDLNDVQEGVLNIAFKIADDEKAKDKNFQLVDLKDLQAWLEDLAPRADQLTTKYGNISKASIGTIQRALRRRPRRSPGRVPAATDSGPRSASRSFAQRSLRQPGCSRARSSAARLAA
jgi:Bacterial protein of unknown function (DUF853)